MVREEEVRGEGTSTPRLQKRKRSESSSQVGKRAQNCGCLVDIISISLAGFQILSLDLCLNMTQEMPLSSSPS